MGKKTHHRKLGRDEPCHCGSGKKYKDCCREADEEKTEEELSRELSIKLNQGIAGGYYRPFRYRVGFNFWAGLRALKGKGIPEIKPPLEDLGDSTPEDKSFRAAVAIFAVFLMFLAVLAPILNYLLR